MSFEDENNSRAAVQFAPRRVRADRAALQGKISEQEWHDANKDAPGYQQLEQTDEAFARNALSVYEGVKQLQDKERVAREELNAANARIEQYQKTDEMRKTMINDLQQSLDAERAERIRLATIIENIGGLVADGMSNVRVDVPGA